MKNVSTILERFISVRNANYLTGSVLMVLGAIDFLRGDYAFAGSWAVFGAMYFAFEDHRTIRMVGSYGGVLIIVAVLIYYVRGL